MQVNAIGHEEAIVWSISLCAFTAISHSTMILVGYVASAQGLQKTCEIEFTFLLLLLEMS
jgi:hypothetical protein